ncbi:threonine ammonia-lyase [Pseudoduganella albidiflava]|uniref:Serine/threonine dehydratase n=1 Tax=Pseudoduganella albidiflava TaxID=321983 RepID=A0A411WY34_9BURK|nr:threonine/serine dehydratase [Pseudoduganella albidiflava]QBI01610.1 threonine/serine dehydratase [Pseudoduganella albidiflava]GGY34279.1 serine/threonine dehydratase [Pseudoduganella albidiflava]
MHTQSPVSDLSSQPYPTLPQIRACADRLGGRILHTPVWRWQTGVIDDYVAGQGEVWLKLELFQKTGTFKLRGALNCIDALDEAGRARGVVAVSAGNHAVAVAYTARLAGCSATVVMPRHASGARIAACRDLGAEVILMPDVHQAFERGSDIAREEGRSMLHPYEGPLTALGTATVGLELMAQVPDLDAVVVPIGGGGLCAGIAAAVKQVNPGCAVYGVEPYGADAMFRSFRSGRTECLERVDTVADSLGAPRTLPYSMAVCQRFVDEVVRVTDDEICRAMLDLFRDAKLVAEPAAAVATAALFGPLRARLADKKVALVVCGSNIDAAGFAGLLARGAHVRDSASGPGFPTLPVPAAQ